jgi:carboxymethylenebutenolidase
MAFREYIIGEVAQDRADGLISRRQALGRLGRLGLSVAAASSLLAACGDDGEGDGEADRSSTTSTTSTAPTSGTSAPADVSAESIELDGPRGPLLGAYATAEEPTANVLVIHENRGMTDHFPDVVARLAQDGYAALVVDLLSPEGTASLPEGEAPARLATAPVEDLVADLQAGIDELDRRAPGLKVGVVGFCFGGGMTWSLLAAGEDRLAAAVPFYGPFPAGADLSGADAAVLAVYAGLDTRVNASQADAVAALEAAGLEHEVRTFEGADHAFFNDTGPRYDAAAAADAYEALLAWFGQHLG